MLCSCLFISFRGLNRQPTDRAVEALHLYLVWDTKAKQNALFGTKKYRQPNGRTETCRGFNVRLCSTKVGTRYSICAGTKKIESTCSLSTPSFSSRNILPLFLTALSPRVLVLFVRWVQLLLGGGKKTRQRFNCIKLYKYCIEQICQSGTEY